LAGAAFVCRAPVRAPANTKSLLPRSTDPGNRASAEGQYDYALAANNHDPRRRAEHAHSVESKANPKLQDRMSLRDTSQPIYSQGMFIRISRISGGLVALLLICAVPALALARIVPGKGIGGVKLGDRMAHVRVVLGKPDRVRPPSWIYGRPLKERIGFGHRQRVNAISTTSPRQRTRRGIGPGSSFRATKEAYPRARCHQSHGHKRAFCTLTVRNHHHTVKTDFAFRKRLRWVEIYLVPPRTGTQVPK